MTLLESILFGFVQGITEFLPISSSGHLTLLQTLLGGDATNFHYFLEWINLGTLLAMIIYFWPQICNIIKNVFVKHDWRLARNIIITCIPAGLAGLLLSDLIENSAFFSSIFTLAIMLGLVGIIMILIDKIPHLDRLKTPKAQRRTAVSSSTSPKTMLKNLTDLSPTRALLIGLAQFFALIPGTSRLGTTMIAGRIMGLNNKLAAEYSFLVAIPLMLAVCLKCFLSSATRDYLFANLVPIALANIIALFVGFIVVRLVMRYFAKPRPRQKTQKSATRTIKFAKTARIAKPIKTTQSPRPLITDPLQPFGYYRVGLAIFVLVLALTT